MSGLSGPFVLHSDTREQLELCSSILDHPRDTAPVLYGFQAFNETPAHDLNVSPRLWHVETFSRSLLEAARSRLAMALRLPCRQLAKVFRSSAASAARRWQPAGPSSGYHVCAMVAIPSAIIAPVSSPSSSICETSPMVAAGQRRLKHGSKKGATAVAAGA